MVDFDFILGMDCLHCCYASFDCQTYKVFFRFPGEPVIEWEGLFLILDLKGLIRKGVFTKCLGLKILSQEAFSIYSSSGKLVSRGFFLDDLSNVPPDKEIQLELILVSDTRPVSIPPHRMALTKLRKLKEKLKDFLDKGLFILVYSYGVSRCCFYAGKMVIFGCSFTKVVE